MGVLLYSDAVNAHVGLSPVLINGVQEHYRSYKAQGHYIYVDQGDENLIYHDVKEILKLKGFRLAEPDEQNEYFAPKQQNTIHEESEDVQQEAKRVYRKRG